jgi:hypothetical protein
MNLSHSQVFHAGFVLPPFLVASPHALPTAILSLLALSEEAVSYFKTRRIMV